MAAPVLVGVRTAEGGATFEQHFVQVGAAVIDAEHDGLVSVTFGPDEPGGINLVTIVLIPSSFATVPFDG